MTAPISNEPTTTRLHHYAGRYSSERAQGLLSGAAGCPVPQSVGILSQAPRGVNVNAAMAANPIGILSQPPRGVNV